MTRGLTTLALLLAALAVALPAAASGGVSLKGTIVAVAPASVSVKDARGVVTTCALGDKSPSLAGYATGDLVQAACVRARGRLVLAMIRRRASGDAPGGSSNDTRPVTFGGVVTAVSATSISPHDGDRDLTCTVDPSSPPTAAVTVGTHAKVACANGVLVTLAVAPTGDGHPAPAPTSPGTPAEHHETKGAAGTVAAVSPTSLTVHTDGGDVTCTVGDGSPSVAAVQVGDRVKIGCLDGALKVLVRAETPPPPPSGDDHHTLTVGGTLTVLSASVVTVHNQEHGDVSCTVGPATPPLGDFQLGDHVGMACVDGVVAKLVRL